MNNQKHTPKHAGDVTKSLKKAAFSYISLFLIVMVLIGTTVSWFTVQDTATLNTNVMVFNSGTGLRVNDGEDITNHITIKNFKLDETSSVDGRNIFLPNGKLQSGVTGDMLYREATASDKNNKFMYADFKIKGKSAGDIPVYIKSYKVKIGDEVYDGSTVIHYSDDDELLPKQIDTHPKCPLRIAFIEDSQDNPKVIDPSVLVDESVWKYNAVKTVDSEGKPTSYDSNSGVKSFSHYYFTNKNGGEPLFNLNNSEAINATIVAWLEGTDDDKTNENNSDAYAGKDISIDIELESNYEDMETITFVDDTIGDTDTSVKQWIGSANEDENDVTMITMTYTDVTTNIDGDKDKHPVRTVVMNPSVYKSDGKTPCEWKAPIPKAVITDITFNRYHYTKKKITSSDKNGSLEEIFNAWYTNGRIMDMWNKVDSSSGTHHPSGFMTKDLQVSRQFNGVNSTTYTATRGNSFGAIPVGDTTNYWKRLSPCVGYWDKSSTPTSSTVASTATTTSTAPPTEYNIYVYLSVPEDRKFIGDNSGKTIRDYLGSGYKFKVLFSDGTTAEMNTENNNDRASLENYTIPATTKITGFRMDISSSKSYSLSITTGDFGFTPNNTKVTFTINDDGKTINKTS